MDDYLLHRDPYPSAADWGRERVRLTEERLSRLPADRRSSCSTTTRYCNGTRALWGSNTYPSGAGPRRPSHGSSGSRSRPSCTAICTYRPPHAKAMSPSRRCRAVIHENVTDGARYAARPSDLTGPCRPQGPERQDHARSHRRRWGDGQGRRHHLCSPRSRCHPRRQRPAGAGRFGCGDSTARQAVQTPTPPGSSRCHCRSGRGDTPATSP